MYFASRGRADFKSHQRLNGSEGMSRTVPDVDAQIASFCSIAELVALARCGPTQQTSVSQAVNERYVTLLLPYFGPGIETICCFSAAVLRSGSAITGSAARWIALPYPSWKPKDLNVVTPRGRLGCIRNFFDIEGWQLGVDQSPLLSQPSTTLSFYRYTKGEFTATITETRHTSIFRHTALASHTAGAVLFTPTALIAFYPGDLDANETVMRLSALCGSEPRVSNTDRRKRLKKMGLKVLSRTSPRGRPCDRRACPGLPRRCRGGRGIGFFRWNVNEWGVRDTVAEAAHDRFADPSLAFGWTFSQCHNVQCDYFGLPIF